MRKNNFFIYLFPVVLITIFPILDLYSKNILEVLLGEVIILIIPFLFSSLLFLFISNLIFKNISKSALFTSFVLLFFYYFHYIFEAFNTFTQKKCGIILFRFRYVLLVVFIFFIFLFYKTLKAKRISLSIFKVLIIIFGMLNIFTLYNIILSKYEIYQFEKSAIKQNNVFFNKFKKINPPQNLPDIYFIILDMYTSKKMLLHQHNYNIDWFFKKLRKLGFYIAEKSKSHYLATQCSISSSLNMRYFPAKTADPYVQALLKNNLVFKLLKSFNYNIFNIRSTLPRTRTLAPKKNKLLFYIEQSWFGFKTLDLLYNFLVSRTFLMYHSSLTTQFKSIGKYVQERSESHHKKIIFEQLKKLGKSTCLPSPKFVLCHILCPHYPNVFATDPNKDKYAQQVEFISNKIFEAVEKIITTSVKKPIIILQGDHGLRRHMNWFRFSLQNIPLSEFELFPYYMMEESYSILNAWYLPDKNYDAFHQSMSPVNNFRIIFNHSFDAKMQLLEDHNFLFKLNHGKLKFVNIDHLLSTTKKIDYLHQKDLYKLFQY